MISKTAKFWSVTGLPQAYDRYIGHYPLAEAGVLGGLGALAGYAGGGLATKGILKTLMAGKSPAQQAAMMSELEQDNTIGTIRLMLGGMGGLAGAGYAALKHGQFRKGPGSFLKSMWDPHYWEKNPEERDYETKKLEEMYKNIPYYSQKRFYSSGRLQKNEAEETTGFTAPRVPVHTAVELLEADPFLRLNQKTVTQDIISNAGQGRSGLVSGHDLMRSAIQAGAGAGVGYVFGRVAGSLLSLPSPVTKRLSAAGALAGALINTGLFSEVLHEA